MSSSPQARALQTAPVVPRHALRALNGYGRGSRGTGRGALDGGAGNVAVAVGVVVLAVDVEGHVGVELCEELVRLASPCAARRARGRAEDGSEEEHQGERGSLDGADEQGAMVVHLFVCLSCLWLTWFSRDDAGGCWTDARRCSGRAALALGRGAER